MLDLEGHYLLPGFIDLHAHFGGDDQGVPAEYPAKLWLAHGITTIREPGSFNGLDWVLDHQRRSEKNLIAAPRIVPYVGFGQGHEGPFLEPEEARAWVRDVARQGARGIKFFGAPPEIMRAALDEARKQGLGSAMHHAQLDVAHWNVLDSARAGLTTMEHWYGLPEAMFERPRHPGLSAGLQLQRRAASVWPGRPALEAGGGARVGKMELPCATS